MPSTNVDNLLVAESATTPELVRSAMEMGIGLATLLKHSPYLQKKTAEWRGLVQQAAPLYRELHSSLPYYADRPLDDPFWSAYVGSRVTEARRLVEAHQRSMASFIASQSPKKSASLE